jgi:trehalose synthase-fused probable maltokinase
MSHGPAIEILNWADELAAILPEYISKRRWYRAKTRSIERLTIQDAIRVAEPDTFILIVRIEYAGKDHDEYLLPVVLRRGVATGDELIGFVGESGLYSAVSDRGFRQALLNLIAGNRTLQGQEGSLLGRHTPAFDQAATQLESFVSRAEQSNTSIVYGDRYILKLFRKLEPGINPDIEIGSFLTERGFKNTPAVLGSIEYKSESGEPCATGILQQFVPNEGDAWSYTLKSLRGFLERALAGQNSVGHYAESAALLGKRTAEMHAAFENENAGPDFAPEPFTRQDGQKLYQDLISQADIAFEALRRKQAILTGAAAEAAREVLRLEPEIMARFNALRESPISAVRIRHHGDYHLGQVLYTGTDFMIIDFEGEPARPLSERRRKALAMRDVAGMLRSFQYAAYAALFESKSDDRLESWAEFWTQQVSAIYLEAYFSTAHGLHCIPSSAAEKELLLDAFLLQKALYELAYELNNRPDWVLIPLRGILSLMKPNALTKQNRAR